jgi:nucleoside-diphosphate-sugar epimerase
LAAPASKRILITGAAGFVGANLARAALARGHAPILLSRPGSDPWRLAALAGRVERADVDLTDPAAVASAVRAAEADWVFHCAAHGAYSWQDDPARIRAVVRDGSLALLEACLSAGVEVFVHAGTSSEYGSVDHAPSEDERIAPNSPYAEAKAEVTRALEARRGVARARLVTLRLYSVYGPWEEPRRFIPTLIAHGLEGRLPPLVDPDVGRDFVHADDACEAFFLAAAHPGCAAGGVFNVATGVQTTIRRAVELARRELGIAAEPAWGTMPNRRWDTTIWVGNPARLEAATGWRPRTGFAEGFRQTVAWLRDDPARLAEYRARQARPPR